MNTICCGVCLLITLAALPAQGLQLTAPIPTTAWVLGTSLQQTTLPAGPLAATGQALAGSPIFGPSAAFDWTSTADTTQVYFDARVFVWNNNQPATQLGVTQGEVLLALSAPTPMTVLVTLTRWVEQPSGAAAPTLFGDVFDDGVPELTAVYPANSTSASATASIGPWTTPIRIRAAATQAGLGNTAVRLQVIVTPLSSCATLRWPVGCGASHAAVPTFDGNVVFVGYPDITGVMVVVLGFAIQPVLLGSSLLPCVAFPSPDALLLFPTWGVQPLTIPAAARPIQFWSQGVGVYPGQFTTSDAFLIQAL